MPSSGSKSELRHTLQADAFRYSGQTGSRVLFNTWFRDPGFRFTWYLRKVAFYSHRKRGPGLFPYVYHRFWLNHYRFRYGFDISPTTSIGSGFYLGHFGGVVISPFAVLGSNVNVAKGATIGATSRGARKGAPTLEENVWVGANATIVGKIKIGKAALIAPGAYVNFDVPANAVVLGNPGRIVSEAGSAGYINNILEERTNIAGSTPRAE